MYVLYEKYEFFILAYRSKKLGIKN